MSLARITTEELPAKLARIHSRAVSWLPQRLAPGQPFGHFQLCPHAAVPDELIAATSALEVWVMLGLPMSDLNQRQAAAYLLSFQNSGSGLVSDPSWAGRQTQPDSCSIDMIEPFFTLAALAALRALGAGLPIPARYLTALLPGELLNRTNLATAGHHPLAVGDYGELVYLHVGLGVPYAAEQWKAINRHLQVHQDLQTGFWAVEPEGSLTLAINHAADILRSTWNQEEGWMRYPERMIDTCLEACEDSEAYSWQSGNARNDLALAQVLYSARCATSYRAEEVALWVKMRLPAILAVQKSDGGFSYDHETGAKELCGLRMSPGMAESDTWGTLMYLDAIKMMVELGYPGETAPWAFSYLNKVPERGVL
jgi:hypothetical protein